MIIPLITESNCVSLMVTEIACNGGDICDWPIREIHAALAEADAGDFASEDEVDAVRQKWA
jgi:predicted transcriptional regulator